MGQSGAGQTTSRASDAVISDRVIATTPGKDSIYLEEQRKRNLPENDLKETVFGREIFSYDIHIVICFYYFDLGESSIKTF